MRGSILRSEPTTRQLSRWLATETATQRRPETNDCSRQDELPIKAEATTNYCKSRISRLKTRAATLTLPIALLIIIDLTNSLTEAANKDENWTRRARHKRWLVAPASNGPSFTEPIGNHTVPLGRDVQLWCKTTNLQDKFRTAWLRVEDRQILSIHDSLITRNYRIGLMVTETSSVLTIKNIQESDKGGYMCQINSVPMRYAVGYLDVLIPPTFERAAGTGDDELPQDNSASGSSGELNEAAASQAGSASAIVVAQEGSNATLSCKARAYPDPTITWRREDQEPIESGGPVELGNKEQLHFQTLSRMHAGAYLCIASNGVPPAASKRLVLDVQFAPVIRVPQLEVPVSFVMPLAQSEAQLSALATAQWGRPVAPSVQLSCFVELNPSGSFHWLRVGANQLVGGSDLAAIEAEQITNSDKYEIVILEDLNGIGRSTTASTQQQQATGGRRAVEMRLNIRMPNKQDLGQYRCLARNSLGSQSGDVKLVEMSQAQVLANQAHATSSSPFAFKELFKFSSSSSSSGSEQGPADTPPHKSARSRQSSQSSSLHIRSNQQGTKTSQQQDKTSGCPQQVSLVRWPLWILVAISSVAQHHLNLQRITINQSIQ